MRKALLTEQGRGEVAARVEALEASERDLARQVAEWRLKCEATEKREGERREAEAKKHKEEVAYLESYARQLKGQLEAMTAPAKKAPAAAVS
jgi:dynein light intermediate chain